MSTLPDNEDETEEQACSIRLNGKTLYEWKDDCETFYHEKLDAE
jgi:hypothetical protein